MNSTAAIHENIARLMLALAAGESPLMDSIPDRALDSGSVSLCQLAIDGGQQFFSAEQSLKLEAGEDYDWILAVQSFAERITDYAKSNLSLPNNSELVSLATDAIGAERYEMGPEQPVAR